MSKRELRGFSEGCLDEFRRSGLPDLLKNDGDLFLGIRDNYANIYYGGTSLGLWNYNKGMPFVKVHRKYLTGLDTEKGIPEGNYIRFNNVYDYVSVFGNGESIKKNAYNIYISGHTEKRVQQDLILKNNRSTGSKWYCTDLEYTQSRDENGVPGFGRFDMIALSRKRLNGKYKLALVELKVGGDAFASMLSKEANENLRVAGFDIGKSFDSFGSGILGHFADFYRFMEYGHEKQLIKETCEILKAKKALSVPMGLMNFAYSEDIQTDDIDPEIEYHFVVVCDEKESKELRKKFRRYLFASEEGSSKYAVESVFGKRFDELLRYKNSIKFHFGEESENDDFLSWHEYMFF